jgi:hypothetical protein
MLQPVKTAPSPVSSAAPTLKCENAASACSRARRAAAIRSISPAAPRVTWAQPAIALPPIPSGRPTPFDRVLSCGGDPGRRCPVAVVEQQPRRICPPHAVDDG